MKLLKTVRKYDLTENKFNYSLYDGSSQKMKMTKSLKSNISRSVYGHGQRKDGTIIDSETLRLKIWFNEYMYFIENYLLIWSLMWE